MKLLRWQTDLIRKVFTPRRITYLGVIMVDIALAFSFYYPLSGEQFGVYWMSQLALLFAGIICVVEGIRAERED